MKTKLFTYLALPILALAMAFTSGCQKIGDGLSTLEQINIVKTSYESMSVDYDEAKAVYAKNKTFFLDEENHTIEQGLSAMDKARAKLKNISTAKEAGKLIAIGDFIASYADAKKGYLLIRSVLITRAVDLDDENLARFNRFDEAAIALDESVSKLKPDGEVGEKVDQFIALISRVSQLFIKE